jgi:hypothetical protein
MRTGFRTIRKWWALGVLFLAAVFPKTSLAAAPSSTCNGPLSKLAALDAAIERYFPNVHSPTEMIPWIDQNVFHGQRPSAQGVAALEAGKNPLVSRWARETMAKSYGKLIEDSDLSAKKKEKLRTALREALDELAAHDNGLWEPDSAEAKADAGKPATAEDFDKFLRSQALRRCILRAGILEGVSEGITATALMVKNWKQYAPGNERLIDQLVSPQTYSNAAKDHYFQLQMVRNGFLMGAIGALKCVPHRYLVQKSGVNPDGFAARWVVNKNNLVAVISMASSILGQGVVAAMSNDPDKRKHWFDWKQTALDVLFVRLISVYKTDGVFYLSDLAKDSGMAHPLLLESLLQAFSEASGALGYSYTQDGLRYLGVLPAK